MLQEVIQRLNQVRPKAAEWLRSFRAAVSIFYSSFFFFICQPRCDRAAEQNISFNPSQGKFPLNFTQLLLFCVLKKAFKFGLPTVSVVSVTVGKAALKEKSRTSLFFPSSMMLFFLTFLLEHLYGCVICMKDNM